jgi:hypothetical protein
VGALSASRREARLGTGQQPWQVLSRLPAWQVTEVPRPRPNRRLVLLAVLAADLDPPELNEVLAEGRELADALIAADWPPGR